ncbi:hypothetical protein D4764_0194800 [Takifugu flavidus]|uniref:PiggyBac transposable element-derived protein domain-containing protein n=1 Tax=Takifugu flavidus TaxID=433684 RepID=A0A5C6MI30_9TELE|nr:hypothetical protein D4764_0194800 [Takifugu flavidus]
MMTTSWMPVINPNLRSKAAVRMRAVVMSTPFHSPLNRAGDVNVSVVKIMGQVQVQAMARPDSTLPEVAVELGMRLIAQMMAQKSQQQDQALRDNLMKPEDTCQRWDKKQKKYVSVSRPCIVREYNLKMGGVDLIDRMISYYRMSSRTKKWTFRMLMHFTDLALANSWLLYRKDLATCGAPRKSIMQFLEFRIDVARTFLAQHHSQEDDADFPELSEGEDDSLERKKTSSDGSAPCVCPQEG